MENKGEKNVDNIRKLKKSLIWGDYQVIIDNIKKKHGITFSKSAISNCLNPALSYYNVIIYAEALKLSLERQNSASDIKKLERKLND